MTYNVQPIAIDTDNWGDLVNKLNELINGASNNFVTIGADPNNGNLVINGDFTADAISTIAVTTNTATITNIATVAINTNSIVANVVSSNTANINAITVSTGNINSLASNTIVAANVNISNTATINQLVVNTANILAVNTANVVANTIASNTANLTTLTSNTINVNRLNANVANINAILFSTKLEGNVSNFTLYGGSVTAKFLTTDGAGTLSYYYPTLNDLSDFAAYSSNVANTISQLESNTNSRIEQVEANSLAFAIALG